MEFVNSLYCVLPILVQFSDITSERLVILDYKDLLPDVQNNVDLMR